MTLPTCTDGDQPSSREHIELADFATAQHRLPLHGYVVYVVSRADGRALYVGQTRHPRTRLRTHRRKKPWWHEAATLDLHPVTDEVAARQLEYDLHGRLRPVYSQVAEHEVFRLRALTEGGGARPSPPPQSRAATKGTGLRKLHEPTVGFRVSVLTDSRLTVLARLVNAWLYSIEDGSVPPVAVTAVTLGCNEAEVSAAYAELLAVKILTSMDEVGQQ